MSTISKARQAELAELRAASIEALREVYPVGTEVSTVLAHVSRSGMYRAIKVLCGHPDGSVDDMSWAVARAIGAKVDSNHGGVGVSGCGMDMGFHVVYALARSLWPEGHPCNGRSERPDRCTSNDHSNGDREYVAGKIHRDGGYGLRHRWV